MYTFFLRNCANIVHGFSHYVEKDHWPFLNHVFEAAALPSKTAVVAHTACLATCTFPTTRGSTTNVIITSKMSRRLYGITCSTNNPNST
ncbi:hypothetical protein DAI22_06g113901 [Oryza sativa Japonica Group]|nr:hypothetical protein DAI22_06g113901 [Oryza sativa Japonica Group]